MATLARRHASHGTGSLTKVLRENGLTIALGALFVVSILGQMFAGLAVANQEALEHGRPLQSMGEYLTSGDFIEAVFENWESEFLQMAVFVVLTKLLFQKGSSESKPIDEPEQADEDPRKKKHDPSAPWPVRKGGLVLVVYEQSLVIALALLFIGSFVLHAVGGAAKHNQEELAHGGATVSLVEYVGTSQFWFESFQNWQSEFFSVAALIVLSIFLRERGSPQSKPVAAPHSETGGG